MRGVEVRNLQLKRIDLTAGEIHLLRSKNRSGVRTISLSVDTVESVEELLVRASVLGADHPDHYLLPALVTQVSESDEGVLKRIRRYDPTKPTKSWRTAWRKLTASPPDEFRFEPAQLTAEFAASGFALATKHEFGESDKS
jgi:integrase